MLLSEKEFVWLFEKGSALRSEKEFVLPSEKASVLWFELVKHSACWSESESWWASVMELYRFH